MSKTRRTGSMDELPLVLEVSDIQRIMGISRTTAYELVHRPDFPAFRSGRLIRISREAFFEWMAKNRI
ncbi:MAG: helix-turn-helix domain-containing protein [Oscillospiraceae bacterium]|nr:helix-turn-helix domain-containing protein [Oscillospiraceae bacterium]